MRFILIFALKLFVLCTYVHTQEVRTLYGPPKPSHSRTVVIDSDFSDTGPPRSKRDAPVPVPNIKNSTIDVKVNHLNDTHKQMMVHWAGEGSNVIICLARDAVLSAYPGFLREHPSSVFISYDYGDTYENKTDSFKLKNGSYSTLDKFYNHPKYNTHFVFADIKNKVIFVTANHGKNIRRIELGFTPSEIQFHDLLPMTFAVLDKADKTQSLWVTKDFGENFEKAQEFVKQFFWVRNEPAVNYDLIVQRIEPNGLSTVSYAHMSYIIAMNIRDLYVKDGYIFTTVTNTSTNNLELYMLETAYMDVQNRKLRCVFDTKEEYIKAFHVVDVNSERAMVVVSHSDMVSHLYVSEDIKGADGKVQFTLSLEGIFSYFPNMTWQESWLNQVSKDAFVDIYKVEGTTGIYIASRVTNLPSSHNISPQHLGSVISFDHGSTWRPIRAPLYDSEGQPMNCAVEHNCSLHLSQKFTHLYPDVRTIGILSSKSAPGLIVATGVTGANLKGQYGVYVSSDGGVTWYQTLRNLYFFNMGDHGGVLTAAEYFIGNSKTRYLMYSTDEGEKWSQVQFFTEEIKLYSLMTEPGENTTVFTMFGSAPAMHQWIIFKVDLRSVFSYNCTKNDYKIWSPGQDENRSYIPCVMGKQLTYERRMPHSNCYNGEDYDTPISTKPCNCDAIDFECDFGFMRTGNPWYCIRNASFTNDPFEIPSTCKPGQYYNRTKGYRKIAGDVCEDGFERHYLPDVIPCPFKEAQQFLLYAQRDRISRLDLSGNGNSEELPIRNLKNVIAIDFDMKNNCVYWADIVTDTIGRQCLDNNSAPEILVSSDLASIEGLALDWIAHTLYFVDGTRARIELIRTDVNHSGRMRRTILGSKSLKKPRGIAVHPSAGYLYWTDWATENPSISRANLDGQNVLTLFRRPQVDWPNGITVDHIAERIYWVDAKQDYIASADLHGHKMTKLISNVEVVAHPFAIAVFKDTMYWDDWKNNAIYAADKDGRTKGVQVLKKSLAGLMDLKVYAHSLQEGTNACSNATCDYICVGTPKQGHSCLCPDGMDYVNGTCLCPGGEKPFVNTTCPKSGSTCRADHMTCDNGICIPKGWRCDGENDCGDNSDEKHCYGSTCEPNFHECDNGKCIPNYWRCDYEKDCADDSDELNCPKQNCTTEQFQCANGRCISKRWKCDRENDCGDNSDEENCEESEPASCKPDEFKCLTGNVKCIPLTWRCDGEKDCRDQSDEENCQSNVCTSSQFSCGPPSNRCIYLSWVCDGDMDCPTAKDEENCTTPAPPKPPTIPFTKTNDTCPTWMTKCGNNICIPNWWRCDGADDCGDGSDEMDCDLVVPVQPPPDNDSPNPSLCKHNEFHCVTGECISEAWVCDGSKDCRNGDDEENCDKSTRCTSSQFKCHVDGSCIALEDVCNQHEECPDGSDERNCEHNLPNGPATPSCSYGYFPCDDNSCHPLSDLCNAKEDCRDGFDERNCTSVKRVYQVLSISTTALKGKWNESIVDVIWDGPSGLDEKLEYMPSISKVGEGKWRNLTWTNDLHYRLSKVDPYTAYNITVYARIQGTKDVFPPAKYSIVTTPEGPPSSPFNVTVQQRNSSHVLISWHEPTHPNGIIRSYEVVWFPPNPPIKMQLNDNTTAFLLQASFEHGQKYTFYVVAHNRFHESPPSNYVTLLFDSESDLDVVTNLSVKEATNRSISLTWDYPKECDGFRVFVQSLPTYPQIQTRVTTKTSIVVDNLAPGIKYTFKIMPFKKSFNGTFSTMSTYTRGSPLPVVTKIVAVVSKDQGNAVKLSWDPPKDVRKVNWAYGIYYGTNEDELYERSRLNTTNLTANVGNLHACEHYYFSVAVVEPYGAGPLRDPLMVTTLFNTKAPPKMVTVARDAHDPLKMVVSYAPSCSSARTSVGYIIHVNETTLGKVAHYGNDNYTKTFTVAYGAIYNVSVSTAVADAIPTPPITYYAPPILPPYEIRVNAKADGVFIVTWTERNIPENLGTHRYEVLVSEGPELNETAAQHFSVEHPPLLFNATHHTYTFAVRTVTDAGHKSPLSEASSVTVVEMRSADPVVSESGTSLTTILVPIFLLVVVFAIVLGILLVRHRRLENSFTRFANSHYDTRSGAATFDDHGLEEEDAPQIVGFSDDEPLVIA